MEILLFHREVEVMQVLWEKGSATVNEVLDALPEEMARTTVLTVLRRIEQKGYAGREDDGLRAHTYFPLVRPQQVQESETNRLTRRFFDGSAGLLLTYLLAHKKISAAELRRVRQDLKRAPTCGGAVILPRIPRPSPRSCWASWRRVSMG